MAGAIVFAVVMVIVVPVAIMFAGAIWSALFGWLSSEDADARAAAAPAEEPEPAGAAH
jgi:hypothetical protein